MNQDERKKFWDVLLTMHDAVPEHLQQLQKTIIVPNTLCRFRAVNENSLAQLQENKLYFSTADYYDDPFDTYFYVNYRLLQQSTDVMYSILANPAHQRDIKDTLMASGIPKEKIDTAIEKTLAHPVSGNSFRELVKESRNRILQSLYSICFCEDPFNENLWLKYAENHHGFVMVYDFYDNSTNLCGYKDVCKNCVIKNNFPVIYPVYYTDNRYDATLYAMSLLLEDSMKHDHVPMSEEIQNRVCATKLWEIEKISLNKKYIHHYDDEWRMVLPTNCANRPFIRLKPKSIIIGLRTSDEDAKKIIIAAHEAGVTDIRKKYIHHYDDEWRMVLPTNCANRPFIRLKPKSIIIGLRTSDEDAKKIIIAAHEAGVTDIRKMCISINDDLEALPVRIR